MVVRAQGQMLAAGLLVLVLACLTHAVPTIPMCRAFLDKLAPEHRMELRNHLQLYQQHSRRARELHDLITHKKNPPTDPKVAHAFSTSLTLPELESALPVSSAASLRHETRAKQLISQLVKEGQLPQNATWQQALNCVMGSLERRLYPYQPVVSFLLEFFKRPQMVEIITSALQEATAMAGVRTELVVNVDEPSCSELWANKSASLPVTGNFSVVPVFSPNLHEARGYNRAAHLARGQFLIILQDDEVPPRNGKWIRDAIALFNKYPKLGVIGMQAFRWCRDSYSNEYQNAQRYEDRELDIWANFVQVVDFAPMAVRRSAFETIGGLDEGLSAAGTCGIWGDWELCNRMWADGFQVMHMRMDGKQPDPTGQKSGTHTDGNEEKCWGRQMFVSSQLTVSRWAKSGAERQMCDMAKELNNRHLHLRSGMQCPWKDGGCVNKTAAA